MGPAWLFPGQGAQYPGMGRRLWDRFAQARSIAEEAEALSGLPLREIARRGPADRLRRCDVLEPVLAAVSLSYAAILREHGRAPAFVAGYSAGEVAALCCAGAITRTDALRIAVHRGRILQDAAAARPGRMIAAYRIPAAVVAAVVAELAPRGALAIAAWNAPDHVTLAGDEATIGLAERRLLRLKAEVAPIDVAGPWHCHLLDRAAERAAGVLEAIPFRAPTVPVYTSASGRIETDPGRLRRDLAEQLRAPVRWGAILDDLRPPRGPILPGGGAGANPAGPAAAAPGRARSPTTPDASTAAAGGPRPWSG
jgi:[acyl-carrier-protein] S-malonyltransferase